MGAVCVLSCVCCRVGAVCVLSVLSCGCGVCAVVWVRCVCAAGRKVERVLPHNRPCLHLYEVVTPACVRRRVRLCVLFVWI